MATKNQRLCHWNGPTISEKIVISLIGAAMLCIAALSYADRQPGSLSTIKTSPSSDRIEIIHRLHNHDAEFGVMAYYGDRSLTLDSLVGRAKLALYVEERFTVAALSEDGVGAPLDLELIGAELDGQFVLVYQEFKGDLPSTLAVRDEILRDIFPEQVNHVNIATGNEIRSLVFQGNDDWQFASMD